MKIFDLKPDPTESGYWWSFRCKADHCEKCKLKFLCYTTSKIVTLWDDDLIENLNDVASTWHKSYKQKEARAEFFDFMENHMTNKTIIF